MTTHTSGNQPVTGWWRKSSFSSGEELCVEVHMEELNMVRDSKNPDGPTLHGDVRRLAAMVRAGVLSA
jgi:hypothetical protein